MAKSKTLKAYRAEIEKKRKAAQKKASEQAEHEVQERNLQEHNRIAQETAERATEG